MKPLKETRGKSLFLFPADYTVIDLETTGLNPLTESIIEVAGLKVRNGNVVDAFSSLVSPKTPLSEFVQEFTGISEQMLWDAPQAEEVIPHFISFIGEDPVVGHNVVFDVSFLQRWIYECTEADFSNDFIDTLRFARKVYPELSHHKLSDLIDYLHLTSDTFHRALGDCQMTHTLFQRIERDTLKTYGTFESFIERAVKHKKQKRKIHIGDVKNF